MEKFRLKPGPALRRTDGVWMIGFVDEETAKTAKPSGECEIDGVKCVDFVDARGREWAQPKETRR